VLLLMIGSQQSLYCFRLPQGQLDMMVSPCVC